jgi:hypothetical protein
VLPNLRSVVARSIHPDDLVSRLDALNQLLVRFLVEMGDDEVGQAMRTLFAIAKGSKGTNLMQRRAAAAAALGKDPDHFRKHLDRPMIDGFAVTIHRDLLRYKSRAKRAPESLEPTGDTPSLNETHFTHQEELVSRIWEKVYALRVEHIAVGRRELAANADEMAHEIEEHKQAAVVEERMLHALIEEYMGTYGERLIMHGEIEWDAEAILSLNARLNSSQPMNPSSERPARLTATATATTRPISATGRYSPPGAKVSSARSGETRRRWIGRGLVQRRTPDQNV